MSDPGSAADVAAPTPPPPAYHPVGGAWPDDPADPPPRPPVTVGAALLVGSGVLLLLGSIAEWYRLRGRSYSGFSHGTVEGLVRGPVFVALGVALLVCGGVQLVVRRVAAAGFVAVALAAVGFVIVLGDLNDMVSQRRRARSYAMAFHQGSGLWIILAGVALALAGGITTLARRRAWPSPV